MNSKILLLALSVAAFSSCSTAYKSGQTPDDVYYSPARVVEEKDDESDRDQVKQETAEDRKVRMSVYDRRWRDLNEEDYSYSNSPYNYCHCNCLNTGYYYNPNYYTWPVYSVKPVTKFYTAPRRVNLKNYTSVNNSISTDPKTGNNTNWVKPVRQYNNSNSKLGNLLRRVITPESTNNNNNSSNNNNRTYTPSNNTNNSSSGSSSSGSSSGSSVPRPRKGGQ